VQGGEPAGSSRRCATVFLGRQLSWRSAAISVPAFSGVIGSFTYIAYTLTEVTGFATGAVPWLLVLFGVGTFVDNHVGAGRPHDGLRREHRRVQRGQRPRRMARRPGDRRGLRVRLAALG
jgi:predicted MFS family arabinose efflux permease